MNEIQSLFAALIKAFPIYRCNSFSGERTQYDDLLRAVAALPASVCRSQAGLSVEGRSIVRLQWGEGERTILLWSQMHGDEGTSTRVVFDLFCFLGSEQNDEFACFRASLRRAFRFVALPMLNPDGAERWTRENALGIDLNRDARRFLSPESVVLRDLHQLLSPVLAYNLHDQSPYIAVGETPIPSTVALLAPPIDARNSVSEGRAQAIRLVECFDTLLQPYIPGGVAKWWDEYEPRAFGEWSQACGTPTLLIESGSYYNDPEREKARSLQLGLILCGVLERTNPSSLIPLRTYGEIPLNRSDGLFDTLRRDVALALNGQTYRVDMGKRGERTEVGDFSDFGSLQL